MGAFAWPERTGSVDHCVSDRSRPSRDPCRSLPPLPLPPRSLRHPTTSTAATTTATTPSASTLPSPHPRSPGQPSLRSCTLSRLALIQPRAQRLTTLIWCGTNCPNTVQSFTCISSIPGHLVDPTSEVDCRNCASFPAAHDRQAPDSHVTVWLELAYDVVNHARKPSIRHISKQFRDTDKLSPSVDPTVLSSLLPHNNSPPPSFPVFPPSLHTLISATSVLPTHVAQT